MAQYSAGFSVAGVNTANTVLANLKSPSTNRLRVLEVGVFLSVAPTTAPDLVLARMNAVGTGTITATANGAHDSAEPNSAGSLETAWATTRPTFLTTYLRRSGLPLTVGAGIIWTFAQPLLIPISAGLCLANILASGATLGNFTGYFNWDE
jgi:hypothetical protein